MRFRYGSIPVPVAEPGPLGIWHRGDFLTYRHVPKRCCKRHGGPRPPALFARRIKGGWAEPVCAEHYVEITGLPTFL